MEINGFDEMAEVLDEYSEAFDNTADELPEIIDEALLKAALEVEARAKRRAPVDTGNLRASIAAEDQPTPLTKQVRVSAEYAPFVEYGTEPHVITPKDEDGVLAFETGGELVFTEKVEHPGTRAQPFLRPALWSVERDFDDIIEEHIFNAIEARLD